MVSEVALVVVEEEELQEVVVDLEVQLLGQVGTLVLVDEHQCRVVFLSALQLGEEVS